MVKKYIFLMLFSSACVRATEQAPKTLAAAMQPKASEQEHKIRAQLTQEELNAREPIDSEAFRMPDILIDNAHDPRYNHLLQQYIDASPRHYQDGSWERSVHSPIQHYAWKLNKDAVAMLVKKHEAKIRRTTPGIVQLNPGNTRYCLGARQAVDSLISRKNLEDSKGSQDQAMSQCYDIMKVLLPGVSLELALDEAMDAHGRSPGYVRGTSSEINGGKLIARAKVIEQEMRKKIAAEQWERWKWGCVKKHPRCVQLYTYCKQSRLATRCAQLHDSCKQFSFVDWWEGWNG